MDNRLLILGLILGLSGIAAFSIAILWVTVSPYHPVITTVMGVMGIAGMCVSAIIANICSGKLS